MQTVYPKVKQLLKECGYTLLRHGHGSHDIYVNADGNEVTISRNSTDKHWVNKILHKAGVKARL